MKKRIRKFASVASKKNEIEIRIANLYFKKSLIFQGWNRDWRGSVEDYYEKIASIDEEIKELEEELKTL